VWLDKGELDKLIDYAGSRAAGFVQAPRPAQHDPSSYRQPTTDPYYSKKHRKKNIFGDLFDFD
jgi:Zn-finger nucleic acid-binding protein